MNDPTAFEHLPPSTSLRVARAPRPRVAPYGNAFVARPEDLLDRATTHALDVRLHASPLFKTWTKFRREQLSSTRVGMPSFTILAPGVARFRLSIGHADATHVELRLPAERGEHFVGFGERFNAVDQRGQTLEVWTEEGAIGMGERLSRILTRLGVSWNPFPKGPTTSYKPFPWMISSRGYGIYFETSAPMFFDVAKTSNDTVVCEVAAPHVDVILFYDAEPKELVQRFAEYTGKTRGVPDWALGPWNDAIFGEAEVDRVASLLRREKIPSSAIWTEDWQNGGWSFFGNSKLSMYNINPVGRDVDRRLYPNFEGVARGLHGRGFKFLGYCYPYVPTTDADYAEGVSKGRFLRDDEGATAPVQIFTSTCAQLDLTHPETRRWHKDELLHAVNVGFDGWMADFGEYTPIACRTYDGSTGLQHHNAYPLLWAKHNREAMDEAGRDEDLVFFSRSAAPGQQAYTSVFWSGDSNTDFERWDGLPSNLPALLSSSLSAMALWTVDIGGYMSLWTTARDEETLARWTELAALLPVMRTHHGTHPRRSMQFDANARTLAHYGTFARLHTALFPLFRGLVDDAKRDGTPVCRPLLMMYPGDAKAWTIEDQFMVGSDLLVAPVITRGARSRDVYLPAGERWVDLWTGRIHPGASVVHVDAPVGQIPLFLRDGGHLVVFDRYVDTLVRTKTVTDGGVRTLDDAEESLVFVVTPSFVGRAEAYDGTTIELVDRAPNAPAVTAVHSATHFAMLPESLTKSWRTIAVMNGKRTSCAIPRDSLRGRGVEGTSPRTRQVSVVVVSPT